MTREIKRGPSFPVRRIPESILTNHSTNGFRGNLGDAFAIDLTPPGIPAREGTTEATIPDNVFSRVVERYIEFHNFENPDPGAKQTHNVSTDNLYSGRLLPVITAQYRYGQAINDELMMQQSLQAVQALDSALGIIFNQAEKKGISAREAYDELRAQTRRQRNMTYYAFENLMGEARDLAIEAIRKHKSKIPETEILRQTDGETLTFGQSSEIALREHDEAENGLDLGPSFKERLNSPDTKVVVLSLDINSTLNTGESHANSDLLGDFSNALKLFATHFARVHPEKQLLFVPNTGRPIPYAWGVIETLSPLPGLRNFGLAEAGGAIFAVIDTQLHAEAAVRNPDGWKKQLDKLRNYIVTNIASDPQVGIEPKQAVLSIQIAKPFGGELIHTTTDNRPVTDDWIKEQTGIFIASAQLEITKRLNKLQEEQPHLATAIAHFWSKLTPRKSLTEADVEAISHAFALADVSYKTEGKELAEESAILQEMKMNLVAKFNSRAGYIDIAHKGLNKYATIFNILRSDAFACTTDQILMVHIGDSGTDIPPDDQFGEDEINEGVDTAYLVGVGNSSDELKNAVRKLGERGKLTARESVLGVCDTIQGIQNALEDEKIAA